MIIPDAKMRGHTMARMKDGPSKTAVVVESVEGVRSNWYDPQQGFVVGFYPADSTPVDAAASNYYPYFGPKKRRCHTSALAIQSQSRQSHGARADRR